MSAGYLVMKVLHVLAVVLFLGNIIIGVFWKAYGDRTRDPKIIAHTLTGINRADRIFTMPAVTVLFVTGFGAQGMGKYPLTLPWILWGLILFLVSAAVFMARVIPIQKRLAALAAAGNMDWNEYQRVSQQWNAWGLIATLAPLVAFVLMILKPV